MKFIVVTAPFTVTSSTKVVNLNADLLDGYDSSDLGKVANDLTQFATTTSTAFRGKINGTTGKFKVYAIDINEATQKVDEYFDWICARDNFSRG